MKFFNSFFFCLGHYLFISIFKPFFVCSFVFWFSFFLPFFLSHSIWHVKPSNKKLAFLHVKLRVHLVGHFLLSFFYNPDALNYVFWHNYLTCGHIKRKNKWHISHVWTIHVSINEAEWKQQWRKERKKKKTTN